MTSDLVALNSSLPQAGYLGLIHTCGCSQTLHVGMWQILKQPDTFNGGNLLVVYTWLMHFLVVRQQSVKPATFKYKLVGPLSCSHPFFIKSLVWLLLSSVCVFSNCLAEVLQLFLADISIYVCDDIDKVEQRWHRRSRQPWAFHWSAQSAVDKRSLWWCCK